MGHPELAQWLSGANVTMQAQWLRGECFRCAKGPRSDWALICVKFRAQLKYDLLPAHSCSQCICVEIPSYTYIYRRACDEHWPMRIEFTVFGWDYCVLNTLNRYCILYTLKNRIYTFIIIRQTHLCCRNICINHCGWFMIVFSLGPNCWWPKDQQIRDVKKASLNGAIISKLTHCDLVTIYGDRNLCQHLFRLWLVVWWHQAITWTNVD